MARPLLPRRPVDWQKIGDLVCAILAKLDEEEAAFGAAAEQHGITLNQLQAATITEAVREQVEGGTANRR